MNNEINTNERFNLSEEYIDKWKKIRTVKFLSYGIFLTIISSYVDINNIYLMYFLKFNLIFFILVILLMNLTLRRFEGYIEFDGFNNNFLIKDIYRNKIDKVKFDNVDSIYMYSSRGFDEIYLIEFKYKIENRTTYDKILDRYFLKTCLEIEKENGEKLLKYVENNEILKDKYTLI